MQISGGGAPLREEIAWLVADALAVALIVLAAPVWAPLSAWGWLRRTGCR